MKKQTAVEWLVKELNQKIDFIPMNKWDEIRDIVQQAKEMEKQQIIDIVEKSRETGLTAEYLLLTYGSKGSDGKCPNCGAMEVDAMSPRTIYECGSSDYDQRPNTFKQSEGCKGSDETKTDKI